jgi:hypothetical protein
MGNDTSITETQLIDSFAGQPGVLQLILEFAEKQPTNLFKAASSATEGLFENVPRDARQRVVLSSGTAVVFTRMNPDHTVELCLQPIDAEQHTVVSSAVMRLPALITAAVQQRIATQKWIGPYLKSMFDDDLSYFGPIDRVWGLADNHFLWMPNERDSSGLVFNGQGKHVAAWNHKYPRGVFLRSVVYDPDTRQYFALIQARYCIGERWVEIMDDGYQTTDIMTDNFTARNRRADTDYDTEFLTVTTDAVIWVSSWLGTGLSNSGIVWLDKRTAKTLRIVSAWDLFDRDFVDFGGSTTGFTDGSFLYIYKVGHNEGYVFDVKTGKRIRKHLASSPAEHIRWLQHIPETGVLYIAKKITGKTTETSQYLSSDSVNKISL